MIDRERIEAIRKLVTTIHPDGPPYDATVLQREDRLLIRAFLADAECIVAALERSEARCERLRRERDQLFGRLVIERWSPCVKSRSWETAVWEAAQVIQGDAEPDSQCAAALAAHDREQESHGA